MSRYSLPFQNYKWLDNLCDPSFPDIAPIEDNGPQELFFEIDRKIPVGINNSVKDCFPLHKQTGVYGRTDSK